VIDVATTALLVVDMQNDFCDDRGYYAGKGLPAASIRAAVPGLARLMSAARDSGAPVLHTRLVHDPAVADVMARHGVLPPGWVATDRRLAPGTWGAEIVPELRPLAGEPVIDRCDYSAFYQTGLEANLRRRGVRTLLLTGTTVDACVLHTAFDAFCRDLDLLIPRECVSGWRPDLVEAALRMVELLLGRVVPLAEVLDDLRGAP
jgi:nicotinamidase-related amidase